MADHSHDLSLLTHAYYVNELDVGRRAAARLLAQDLDDGLEQRVRANRIWYTPTLSELGSVEFQRINIPPALPNWSLFNPTLLSHNGELIGLVRSSNYTMSGMHYIMPPEDNGMIRTKSILVRYDDSFSVVSSQVLADPDYEKTGFAVDGLEDCRLYSRGDDLYVSATVRNFAPFNGNCRIGTARIDRSANAFTDMTVLEAPAQQHEKNWMPVIGQDCWLYSCSSDGQTKIVRQRQDAWKILSLGVAPKISKAFRGGSQLVPFDGGYLCVIHEVVIADNNRTYEHRFVWFDDQLRIKKIGGPFYFRRKKSIEFAAGIAARGDKVIVTFGAQDKEAWLAVLSREFVGQI